MPATNRETPLEFLLKEFLTYLEITKNRAKPTIRNYRFYLNRFLILARVTKPADITERVIKEYRLQLNRWIDRRGKGLSKITQNYHLIALRAFLKFMAKEDQPALAPEKVELMRVAERQVDFLEAHDLEALLAQPMKANNPERIKLRDRAMLETLFSTGLRVSELAALKRTQLNTKREEISIRGKGGKVRVVFLSPESRGWLERYLGTRRDNAPHVFVRHDRAAKEVVTEEGKPLTPRSMQRLISQYAKLAGITKRVTPHTMRHTYATDLLVNGADLRSVQALLGHASITTTQIYTHVTNQQLHQVHQAFHARRRKKG